MDENSDNVFDSIISGHTEPSENYVVRLVNELIVERQLDCPRIRSLKSLNTSFFSDLFRNIFGYPVPDATQNPTSREEEIHNAQSVIDTLSLDILSISLSHITGEDIVARNPRALYDLLRIFKGYLAITKVTIKSSIESFLTSSSISDISSKHFIVENHHDALSKTHYTTSSNSTCVSLSLSKSSSIDKTLSKSSESQVSETDKPESIQRIIHLKREHDCLSSSSDKISKPLDHLYKEVFKPETRRKATPIRRSVLIPRYLKAITPKLRAKNIPKEEFCAKSGGLITEIKSALPVIELSKETRNVMRKQCVDHLKFMTNNIHNLENKKRKAQKEVEDAVLKQRKLLDMAKKDAEKERKVAEAKQAKFNRIKIQSILKDYNLRKARMNKYYKNYHLGHRKRLSSKSNKEEMLLKNVLNERLDLQKQNLNRISKEMREEEKEQAAKIRRENVAMANFYETQMTLLNEGIKTNKTSTNVRMKSQQRALEDFKRETRRKIEKEIEQIQDDLETRDDFHFRLTDAERLRQSWK